MSNFEIGSTVMKLVIKGFIFYICIHQTMVGGDGISGQHFQPKVNLLSNVILRKFDDIRWLFDQVQ